LATLFGVMGGRFGLDDGDGLVGAMQTLLGEQPVFSRVGKFETEILPANALSSPSGQTRAN
jgi:hypothetical protein